MVAVKHMAFAMQLLLVHISKKAALLPEGCLLPLWVTLANHVEGFSACTPRLLLPESTVIP